MVRRSFIPVLLALLLIEPFAFAADRDPRFGRDVRPILAKHCLTCHGPDAEARESDLRLDRFDAATADLGGYAAIVPGNAESSELIARVTSDEVEIRMPPADSHPPLADGEIETLRRWINAGAVYETHWAFVPPSFPQIVDVQDHDWCQNIIDRFVLRRIEQAGLSPAPRARRESLVRRLYLDLTGTTPVPSVVDDFVNDDRPAAYQRLVDRLLATPEYAERFARPWLDLARYADTNGYEKDRPRTIWPYRDWVIRAIAADMPLDQFSIQQLAGDMLPNATNDQLIATGFHRNTMLNEEGGIDPLEFRFHAIVDRVATTGTVWMGLTIGCAQCHSHKYDPISHQDYYSLMALLNNADEPDVVVSDPANQQLRAEMESQLASLEQRLIDDSLPSRRQHDAGETGDKPIAAEWAKWYQQQTRNTRNWRPLKLTSYESTMPKLTSLDDSSILASGDVTKRDVYRLNFELPDQLAPLTAIRLEALPHPSLPAGGPGMGYYEGRRGDFFVSEMSVSVSGEPAKLTELSHNYGKISVGSGTTAAENVIDGNGSTGWSAAGNEGKASQLVANFVEPVSGNSVQVELLFERHFAAALGRFRISVTSDAGPTAAANVPQSLYDWHVNDPSEVSAEDYRQLQRHFVRSTPSLAEQRKPILRLRRSLPGVVRTLGMRERLPVDRRTTRRHHRGEYLQGEEEVVGAVPAMFEPLDSGNPKDRLSLARWLVSDKNPLFARVTVNRAWREFFGTGMIDTAGDYGTQSEPPSHPLLLDWLASELAAEGWSGKRLHRRIVMSSTYQQAVTTPPASDPRQRLIVGFPHRRLDAERVRDALLSASGLLSRRVGGPSVYPPQSKAVTAMAWGNNPWKASQGADRYRRSLYTFSKRTAPFAAFTTFDGPSGETCTVRRDRSTTPLQALTLLNDQMYMEIAAGLADTTRRSLPADATAAGIAAAMFRRLLVRSPDQEELDAMLAFYESLRPDQDPWKLIARALMNADEAITTP